ncbi:uncharacterized protein BT62DRAFT_952203 [Guyanagaster necrorhizus]|uniref:DUF6533 domain-containing protein n=1 Tax=Guyanagaster necrorhizus TaxID=856835 RepID=A0A9P7VPJ3_9AGAR|nr:uncharacterized protein BT62DRAFT_952203 [Guyanagaster necrorhizus MCA 3950]KAG7444422.1 hypothetical protein BT62DRAFT_952203 [Guyanagaster necrorhizus MCA 3950]
MATKAAATHFLQFRIQYSSIALIYYDYALTFPTEVKYVWGSKFRLSTVLYIFCRYALVANVLYLLAIAKKLGARVFCDTWYKIIGALSVLGRAAIIVAFTGRTYAIFARSRIILFYLVAIGLTCVILDIMHVPGLKCVGSSSNPLGNDIFLLSMKATEVSAAANLLLSILMVVFEYSSAILMTIRSIQAFKVGGPWKAQRRGFAYLVFEQGILYFGFVSLFTTAAVILNSVAPAGFFQRLLNALTLPLSGLLTARFLLRLRVWEHKQSVALIGGNNSRHTQTMEFRAPSLVDEFGEDPVSVAARQDEYMLEESRKVSQENMPSTSSMVPGYHKTSKMTTAHTESSG